jgi:peroxiredoxin
LIFTAAAVGLVGSAVAAWFLWGARQPMRARRVRGKLLFDEHITPGPGNIYTAAENAVMAAKIDYLRFVTDPLKRREVVDLLSFGARVGVGEQAPDFELTTTGGETVRLSDLRGRHVVFMFAAMTCPPARMQTPRFEALRAKYSPHDVAVLLVYSRERHAGERGYPEFQYASSDAEKMALARMLAALTSLPIAVDNIEETTLHSYGAVPNSCYVINREGTIVYRSTWADSRKVEQALNALLEAEKAPGPAGVLIE